MSVWFYKLTRSSDHIIVLLNAESHGASMAFFNGITGLDCYCFNNEVERSIMNDIIIMAITHSQADCMFPDSSAT